VDVNHNIRGNEDLKAERSNNYSASLAWNQSYKQTTYKAEAMFFYNGVRDMISLALVNSGTQLYSYINVDKFKSFGVNLNGSVQFKGLSVSVGYSRIARFNQMSDTSDAPAFSYSNEFNFNPSYSFKKVGVEVSLFCKYTGKTPSYMIVNGEPVQTFTDAYTMMDGSITKSFRKNMFSITVGAKNLTNVKTINTTAMSGGAHSSGSNSLLIGMGRFYFVSFKINISKS
jgi:outer membrane receptor for ferrienterochelin and colicins